ncbi:MAG: inorganic phosphate transporter [Bacteroidota bacterium]
METYYLLIIVVLFILAISDLIVGVSNDAVNFLNSAIGSKAAPYKIIIFIAAAGVLIGATFSNGMMEVARKGVFHPDMFSFSEIMVIFLAVMMTDILLLDVFNTLGLPTSTTVSIVFELLGSAVAVSIYKITRLGWENQTLGSYINSDRALGIIAGIFISVVIAFTAGLIIQWLIRFLFTFNIQKTYKYWGGIWGGLSLTVIIYFLLIKGAKGSSLLPDQTLNWIESHAGAIMLYGFIGWTLILQLLILFTKFNVLKVTVLLGTFALAMAFAGNDLVNFIGVPLAGFESFKAFFHSGIADPNSFTMEVLKEPVRTAPFFLIIAGLVMVLTLRFSRKAQSVTATTIDLSRQSEGSERFESSFLARVIVRRIVEAGKFVDRVTSSRTSRFFQKRFDQTAQDPKERNNQAFDMVRASVNLVVASILIAFGTSLKLPLSTTYVTFMVAMGTSLADGAWGRESAVYRITGVLTVVGGWFFTALLAFVASFLLATFIYFGKLPMILVLIALSVFIVIRTHAIHKKKTEKEELQKSNGGVSEGTLQKQCEVEVRKSIVKVSKLVYLTYISFSREKIKDLKKIKSDAKELSREIKEIKANLPLTLKQFKDSEIESGHFYVQVIDYLRETVASLQHIIQPVYNHVDNNHPMLDQDSMNELLEFNEKINEFFNYVLKMINDGNYEQIDDVTAKREQLLDGINDLVKKRIKSLKKTQKGTKVSITYIEMLTETKGLILQTVELLKANRKFIESLKR